MRRWVIYLLIATIVLSMPISSHGNSDSAKIIPVAAATNEVTLSIHADKTEVNPGDTVKLTVTLETNLPLDRPSKLLLYVNGKVMKEISLSPLDAGVVLNYEFDFTPDAPGYYVIQVTLVKQAGVVG